MKVLILVTLICEKIILIWLLLPKTQIVRYLKEKKEYKRKKNNESIN